MSFLDLIISFINTYSMDVAIIAIVFVGLAIYGLWFEKNRLTSFILSFYITSLLFSHFPFVSKLIFFGNSGIELILSQGVGFLGVLAVSILVLNRVIKGRFPPSGIVRWFKIVLLSAVSTGALLALSYHALPAGAVYNFSAPIASIFEPAKMLFWWLLTPLAVLFITSKPAV